MRYFLAALAVASCLAFSVPVMAAKPKIEKVSALVTTGADTLTFKRQAMSSFSEADRIYHFMTVRWEPIDKGAGRHEVIWRWSVDGKVLSEIKQKPNFHTTPFELQATLLGTAMGAGRGRIDVLIDGQLFDSREFDVVAQNAGS